MRFKISISVGLLISILSFVLAIAILIFQLDYETLAGLNGSGTRFSVVMSPPVVAIISILLIASGVGPFIKRKPCAK